MPKPKVQDILQRGVKSLLEEAKVPLQYHLKVVKALHKAMADNQNDRNTSRTLLDKYTDYHRNMTTTVNTYSQQVKRLTTINHLKGEKGDPGEDGLDGISPSVEDIINAVLPRISRPKDGTDGKPGKDAEPVAVNTLVTEVIRELQKGDKLHISQIRGGSAFIKDGIKYRFEELMHGGGSKSIGGSGYQIPTSGSVNGSNQIFVWATAPNVIVVDQGRPMQRVSSDGTINWTGTTTTTLEIAPNFDIFATA